MERIKDSGSNYQFYDHQIEASPARSLFDLSYIHTSSFRIGALYPVFVQWTLPKSDYRINISNVIRSMPMTVPLMSRLRVFFHFYYCSWTQLWNKAQAFVTRTATGKSNIEMPYISECNTHNESLWRYFGLPQFQNTTIVDGKIVVPEPHDVSALHVSALPFMMYQKIYRDYYLDRNYQFNSNGEFDVGWYPDEEEDFRIQGSGVALNSITPVEGLDPIDITVLRYRNFAPDYFTSALPKPQLGEPIGISLAGNTPVLMQLGDSVYTLRNNRQVFEISEDPYSYVNNNLEFFNNDDDKFLVNGVNSVLGSNNAYSFDPVRLNSTSLQGRSGTISNHNLYVDLSNISSVTIDQLRLLNANQIEMERAAKCDGTYGSFMQAFFGVKPKSSKDMRPTYIGGSYQPIIVSDVVQSSSTTNTSVQGNQTGKGFSSDERANIGSFYSDDFGIIMGIMSIVPDTYYDQGIDRDWTVKTQDDLYFPDRAGLSMQEIKLKELFAARTNTNQNETIFAYQNRFDEKRFRSNIVTGYVGDSSQLEYSKYIQTRHFNTPPTYSQSWVTMEDNIDYEQWFAKKLEPPFIGQILIEDRAVQPLPYKGVPSGLFGLSS